MLMSLVAQAEPVPLHTDADGVVRVAGTRVTLDTVLAAYRQGSTPEQIAEDYSSLETADVYAVITYYLRHRDDVDAYLEERSQRAEEVRREIEARHSSEGLRERLEGRLH